MGSSDTSVASNVVALVAVRLPAIRLPTETRCVPMRPVNGAAIRQWSSPNCALIRCALVHILHASSVALLQILGTVKLSVSQFQTSRCNVELGSRLSERNLVGARINGEKEVTLPHDVPVLEKYSSERAAYLRAQLHLRDGRK